MYRALNVCEWYGGVRWVLSRLATAVGLMEDQLGEYDFGGATQVSFFDYPCRLSPLLSA